MTWRRALVLATVVVLAVGTGAVVPGAVAAQDDCTFPVTATDATGTDVTLDEEPEEIVVTGASAAQTVWELGEEDRVVGMPVGPGQGTDTLDGADDRTHVLEGVHVDAEQIVDLDPDLVIAPGITAEEDVEELRDLGLTVYYEGDAESIADVQENVRTTGDLIGACEAADETVEWMDETLDRVDEAVEDEDRPTVYYWLGEGFTAPAGSFQHDLLERAGARNAAANMTMDGWALSDEEQIVEEDPEYLLLQEGDDVPDSEAIQATTAVQEDNVIVVDRNDWNQDAPRVVLAVEQIAEQLHPAAFEATDAPTDDATTDAADDATTGATDDTAATDDDAADDADGTPGFGLVAAVLALSAVASALVRRQ